MKKLAGFTLVEISIVLLVVGLLLSGLMSAYQNQVENNRIQETRQAMADIRDALYGFTLGHGHLPCPANPSLANHVAGAGQEARAASGDCAYENGVIPWSTLGTKELDAWGGRYTYRVTAYFADTSHASIGPSASCVPAADVAVSFAICSAGDIIIQNAAGSGGIPSSVAVIVSHGKNKRGAYTQNGGTRLAGAAGSELENANDDPKLVSQPFTYDNNLYSSTYYDDLVEWIPTSILIGKMATANRLP